MNTRSLTTTILVAALACMGCEKQEVPLTEAQKTQMIQEAKAVSQAMASACEKLDIDLALKDCVQDPEFLAPGMDGQLGDLKVVREANRAFFATLSSLKFTTLQEEFRVLAPDLLLHVWVYKAEAQAKNGDQDAFDPIAASLLLRKTSGGWKIVLFHESGPPPKHTAAQAKK